MQYSQAKHGEMSRLSDKISFAIQRGPAVAPACSPGTPSTLREKAVKKAASAFKSACDLKCRTRLPMTQHFGLR